MTEKNSKLPTNECYGAISSHDEKRQPVAPKNPSRAVSTVVSIIIICLGLARITGVFEPKEHVPITIVERAKNILKENPLIG
jgi:hypothetical protein